MVRVKDVKALRSLHLIRGAVLVIHVYRNKNSINLVNANLRIVRYNRHLRKELLRAHRL